MAGDFLCRLVSWKIIQKGYCGRCMINAATVVRQAVGDEQVRGFVDVIIAANLVKNSLRQGYMGGFAFDYQKRTARPVKYNDVGSFLQAIQGQATFCFNQRLWVLVVADQQMYHVLPHPLLRRNADVLPAQDIENVWFPVDLFKFAGESG